MSTDYCRGDGGARVKAAVSSGTILVAVNHRTTYRFDRSVRVSPHLLRFHPAATCHTPISSYKLTIEPTNHEKWWEVDECGNRIAHVIFHNPLTQWTVQVQFVADLVPWNPFDFLCDSYAEYFPFDYASRLHCALKPFLHVAESGPRLMSWVEQMRTERENTVTFVFRLLQKVHSDISWALQTEKTRDCDEVLAERKAGGREWAWLLVQILRHLGLAARFVTGYSLQLRSPVLDRDKVSLGAWVEFFLPGAGWIGLCPDTGHFATAGEIPLMCSAHWNDANVVEGATDPCKVELEHHETLTRL